MEWFVRNTNADRLEAGEVPIPIRKLAHCTFAESTTMESNSGTQAVIAFYIQKISNPARYSTNTTLPFGHLKHAI